MTLPVLVTIPFGDANQQDASAARLAFEDRLIEAMEDQDYDSGRCVRPGYAFSLSYFYPYRNPNSTRLEPQQLYTVMNDELDCFKPAPIRTVEEFRAAFPSGGAVQTPHHFRHAYVPAHTNKSTGEQVQANTKIWLAWRYMIIADDVSLHHLTVVYVDVYDAWRRVGRKLLRSGVDASRSASDRSTFSDEYASDVNCEERERPGKPNGEYGIAAQLLGLSIEHCVLYGIKAAHLKPGLVAGFINEHQQSCCEFSDVL